MKVRVSAGVHPLACHGLAPLPLVYPSGKIPTSLLNDGGRGDLHALIEMAGLLSVMKNRGTPWREDVLDDPKEILTARQLVADALEMLRKVERNLEIRMQQAVSRH